MSVGIQLKRRPESYSMSRFNLDEKVAVATGGDRGRGKAISLAYAAAGADVVVAARRVEPLNQVVEEIQAMGRRAMAIPTDVTEPDQVSALVSQTVDAMGQIHIMVANSGGGGSPPFWTYSCPTGKRRCG